MLRRLPTSRLIAFVAATAAALVACTAIAFAALGGAGAKPAPKPLATAIHDALTAPAAQGVTARITFTNRLIDASSITTGTSPLLSGATGRLWAAADGRFRLELQSPNGDAQVTGDGNAVSIYDPTTNQAYRITLPQDTGGTDHQAPSLTKIQDLLTKITGEAQLSGATPSNVAGRPAYTVEVSPKHDGGLIGSAQLAWDAATGVPLRVAVYASGNAKPVLELKATDISFGPVSSTDLTAKPPAGTKVTELDLSSGPQGKDPSGTNADVTGPKAVAAKLGFPLSAPDTLVGLPRREVRLVNAGEDPGALVTYGAGLGGIAVLEQPVKPGDQAGTGPDATGGLALPKVSIDGTDGQELATALGTVVRFQRGGVQYTIIGSVPPSAAEAAARGL